MEKSTDSLKKETLFDVFDIVYYTETQWEFIANKTTELDIIIIIFLMNTFGKAHIVRGVYRNWGWGKFILWGGGLSWEFRPA